MTTELDLAKNGEFLREYGKQYFVVFSEALNIGRVKVNMVPIGRNGKDGIVFYLTTDKMTELCYEIVNGAFAKKIAADNNSYPSAYRYVTGTDGGLHLNIGGGKMGCRIQMQDASAKKNYLMAVSTDAMKTMARRYLMVVGLTPLSDGCYYHDLMKAFIASMADRAKYHKINDEDITDVVDENSIVNDEGDSANGNKGQTAVKVNPQDAPKAADKPDNKDAANVKVGATVTKKDNSGVTANYKLTIAGKKSTQKGLYVFRGSDQNGEEINLVFNKDEAENLSWFKKLEDSAVNGGTTISIFGEKRGAYIMYKGPAKKTS